jgi:hypothetical protein
MARAPRRLALALALGLAAPASPARAQTPPPAAGPNTDEEARALFRAGDAHYAAGRYEQAAASFEAAYRLSGRPALLFNLANAHERMGNYEQAANYLRHYLETPNVPDVVSVRERLARLELTVATKRREAAVSAPGATGPSPPATAPAAPPPPAPAPEARRPPSRGPVYVFGAVGALGAATAITFGLLTNSERSKVDGLCSTSGGELYCRREAGPHLDRERQYALTTDVAAGVAVASAGTAVVWWLLTRRPSGPRPGGAEVSVAPPSSRAPLGVSVSAHF